MVKNRGMWIGEGKYIDFSDFQTSLSKEIAIRSRAVDFYSLGMFLPNPDPILKKIGKDITVYNGLMSDGHVGGCVLSRKAGVRSLCWGIDRGNAKSHQAKFVESIFKDLDVRRIIGTILNAIFYGYQPLEVVWKRTENFIVPADVVGKPKQWFVFDENNNLRFRTKSDPLRGEGIPDKTFLLAQHEPEYDNPYGYPVLSSCFWPVTFKKAGFKFWITFTEKFGMPFIVGKQPRGTSKEETDKFADQLESMVQDAISVIPDDASIEIPETSNTGSADLYDSLIRACISEINVALLGHSAGASSTPGKLGGENQAINVRKDIILSDKHMVEDEMNKLIRWIIALNFAERAEMPGFSMWEKTDVDKTLSERDNILTKIGVRFSKKYFMRAYGLDEEDITISGDR